MGKNTPRRGQIFGMLTALQPDSDSKPGHEKWFFRCDCGVEKSMQVDNVRRRAMASCGCNNIASSTTHHETKTSLYRRWAAMKARCQNPSAHMYHAYGGRGIRVCDAWQRFEPFRDWAASTGYDEALTLDRINTNGGYEPGNCRWVPWAKQYENKRVLYESRFTAEQIAQALAFVKTPGGEKGTQAAARIGLPYSTFFRIRQTRKPDNDDG